MSQTACLIIWLYAPTFICLELPWKFLNQGILKKMSANLLFTCKTSELGKQNKSDNACDWWSKENRNYYGTGQELTNTDLNPKNSGSKKNFFKTLRNIISLQVWSCFNLCSLKVERTLDVCQITFLKLS